MPRDANARLIAAAPEMLAALHFAAVKVRLLCQELGRSTDADCQQIDDAIEKSGAEHPC